MTNKSIFKKVLKEFSVLALSVAAVVLIFHIVLAGSLTPTVAPAPTFHSLDDIYNELVGTLNSSGNSPSSTASAVNISRCIMNRLAGIACP